MSHRIPFFGGNWKMNHGPSATRGFVEEFIALYPARDDRTVVFFPPALSVTEFRSAASGREDLRVGVQDVYWESAGAFTGSLSAAMAKDAGAEYVLAGHSERRHIFGDSNEAVARKVEAIAAAELIPVLCVGEQLDERERDEVESVVSGQLEAGLSRLQPEQIRTAVIAYEPVWAIGSGRTASAEDANEVHGLVRTLLSDRLGEPAGRSVPIIYGGSVKPSNIDELLSAPEIDGVLVGGASLKPGDFSTICNAG